MKSLLPRLFFVHDRGQMCNNILQYGHVYAWARENGYQTISMRFAYKYQYFNICHTPWHHFDVYVLAKYAAKFHLIPTFDADLIAHANEEELTSQLRQLSIAWIDGWNITFPDLFKKYLQEIRALFAFTSLVEQNAQLKMMPWLTRKECLKLGVHIRRGDYARFLGGKYFYDDHAMIRFIRQFQEWHNGKQMVVFVCGNDPQMQSAMYEQALPNVRFVFPQGNPGEDLCVLSHCDYIMGAPSTFSLVAAMYRDVPIWWIPSSEASLSDTSFSCFDSLLRQIKAYHSC